MKLMRLGFVLGFVIWAAATALFVPLGRFVFGPDNRLPVALSTTLIVAATFLALYRIARRVMPNPAERTVERAVSFGACACLPGLLLDGALYAFNGGRYPGLDASASGAMTAALLPAYAAALLGALSAASSATRPTTGRPSETVRTRGGAPSPP